jgi:hypothetical protein
VITLTHVCRAWREVFTSRSSLWTNLNCENKDQAHVYLERSKSLPVNLSLNADDDLPSYHPFFEIIPRAVGRLGSLFIGVLPEDLQTITAHLSHPAPLLENRPSAVISVPHTITRCSHPHSSAEISLRYASCVWSAFAPSYLGGT